MTTAHHVTFSGAIRDAAAALGREPTPEQVSTLNVALQSLGRIDAESGIVTVETDAGTVPVDVYLAREAAAFPKATISTSTPPNSASSTPSQTQADRDADLGILRVGSSVQHGRPRGDGFADITRAIQAQNDAALARQAAAWPNPWLAGQVNRTHQTVLSRIDPARAAKFRAEAGVQ